MRKTQQNVTRFLIATKDESEFIKKHTKNLQLEYTNARTA